MRTIISILSDQLIPNLIFIKNVGKEGDFHVFLTTDRMELANKSEILADVLSIEKDKYLALKIDSDNASVILQQLHAYNWNARDQYVVNITGGTKIMSQMAFTFFKDFEKVEIFYCPLKGDYLDKIHPVLERQEGYATAELDLKSYLAAHGYTFTGSTELSSKISRAEDLYNQICKKGDSAKVKLIANAQNQNYYKLDKPYLTGKWFEEWLYYNIKESLKLDNSQIAYNLKLKSRYSNRQTDSDNEIDVAFVYKNNLYIVECKVYTKKQMDGEKITRAIYKIATLRQSIGLKASACVAILSDFGNSNERENTLKYLCEMTKVERVFSLKEMSNKESFIQDIKNTIDYE